jgi:8-oxo-dGTP pyrophosphatase MutT (NUDIX family)
MRHKLWRFSGAIVFWLGWPVLFVYLRFGYRTRVLIVNGDEALVVKGWLGSNRWQLPGGGVHRGESSEAGALREIKEETGITLTTKQLAFLEEGVGGTDGLHFRYYGYLVELPKRPIVQRHQLEITEAAWVPVKDLGLDNATEVTYQLAQAWLKK